MSYVMVRRPRRRGMGDLMADIAAGNAAAVAYAVAHPEDPMSAKTLIANQAQQGALLASGYAASAPLPTATPAGWNPTVWSGVLQGRLVNTDGVQAQMLPVLLAADPALSVAVQQQMQQQQAAVSSPVSVPSSLPAPLPGGFVPAPVISGSSASAMLSAPIFGIPAWMLLAGGVGALILFGGKH